jgi:type I restriction enzyme S subunit
MNEVLPLGWALSTIEDCVNKLGLFTDGDWIEKKDQDINGRIRLLQLADVGDGKFIDKSSKYINENTFKKLNCTEVFPGDILLARMPQPLGRACILPSINYRAITAVDVCIIRPCQTFINPIWLHYFINAAQFRNRISELSSGTTRKRISRKNLGSISLFLPPLNEQKRIVAKLDKIIPRIDKVKERLDKIPVIIKRFRQSVLTAAVTGKLTEEWREENPDVESAEVLLKNNKYVANTDYKEIVDIPSKWCWCALGNYAELSRGRFSIRPRNDPRYYDGKYPFIQIGDLPREGGCINSHRQTLNEKGLKISKEFEQYTIAIAIVGATIGNTGILAYKMCFPDSLIGIKMKTKFESFYTDFYLRTEKENIRNISYSSGGQPNIKLPKLTGYPFPLPPLEEQKEIVRQVDNLFALADKLETHYQKAKAKVDKLSQSVLAKAFRGELVPQDPNDEPAEKLLERIMKEKAKMEAELKKTNKKKSRKKAKSKQ